MKLEAYSIDKSIEDFSGFRDNESGLIFHKGECRKNLRILKDREYTVVEDDKAQPTHVRSVVLQYVENGVEEYLPLEKLRHIRTVKGSPSRKRNGNDRVGISTESHTYHLFLNEQFGGDKAVVAVSHGDGIHFYKMPHCFFDQTICALAESLSNDQFWDVCDMLIDSYEHGKEHGTTNTAKKYTKAFVEGRLKKRRRNGSTYVEIVERNEAFEKFMKESPWG
jgi:hypothetical protein